MQLDDIRFLFAFDRWATTKILDATEGVDPATWDTAMQACATLAPGPAAE